MLKHEGKGERERERERERGRQWFCYIFFFCFLFSGLEFWVVWIYLCWIGWVNLKEDNVYQPWKPKKKVILVHVSYIYFPGIDSGGKQQIFLEFYF